MKNSRTAGLIAVTALLAVAPGFSQQIAPERTTVSGTVVSASRTTLLVRTQEGRHVLFVFEDDAEKPESIAEGQTVRVVSRVGPDGTRVASDVALVSGAGSPAAGQGDAPVPPEVRRLEGQIERQMRRYRAGVRAGVGLDPEVLTAGVHAKLGPFFHRDVWFRPNAEFGFGEVTTLAALNFEAVYRLPINERQSRWSAYIGAGPGLNFIDRNFEEAEAGDREIDFSDFDFEGSLNILAGVENRNGMFLELKTAAFARPTVRILVGYSF